MSRLVFFVRENDRDRFLKDDHDEYEKAIAKRII